MEGYGDIVQWLLEEDTPRVGYNNLRHILQRPPEDTEAKRRMMESLPVSKILARQNPDSGLPFLRPLHLVFVVQVWIFLEGCTR